MAPDLPARVARAISETRKARGMSQEGLAAALGIAVKNVQRIEGGRQNLTLASLDRIARALGVDAGALFGAGRFESAPSALARLERAGYDVRASTMRGRRPEGAIPVTTIHAAAGALTGEARVPGTFGWLVGPTRRAPPTSQFVAEVRGHSMEPRLASGSLVLFGPASGAPYGDRLFLVASNDLADAELGGPFVVKRIQVSAGKSRAIRLVSVNPAYPPIVLRDRDAARVIAEVVRVLVAGGEG